MKKLYTLFLATALSATAFAETPLDGKWQFTVYEVEGDQLDLNNLQQSTITLTASSIENEVYWNIDGTTYGFYGNYVSGTTPYCRFDQSADYLSFQSVVKGPNGSSVVEDAFYVDDSEFKTSQLFAAYSEDSQSFTEFRRKGVLNGFDNAKSADMIGFDLKENGTTFKKYIITAAKKVAENENSIKLTLAQGGQYPSITKTDETYTLMERIEVLATGYDSYTVYYSIKEKDGEVVKEKGQAEDMGNHTTYEILEKGLDANKEFILTAWAESGDYKSEEDVLEFSTVQKSVTIQLSQDFTYPYVDQDYDDPSKSMVIETATVSYTGFKSYDEFEVFFKINVKDGEEVVSKSEAETDNGEMYIIYGYGLDKGKDYVITAWAEADGYTSEEATVEFSTGKPAVAKSIIIGNVTNTGASFRVASATAAGFDDDDPADVYFMLKNVYMMPEKATYNESDGSYEYTFKGLEPGSYTAQIFGGKGDDFQDFNNLKEVPFTVDSTTAIESIQANDANARYYNLNGIEVKNVKAGNMYIKVVDGVATKVLVK